MLNNILEHVHFNYTEQTTKSSTTHTYHNCVDVKISSTVKEVS